MTRTLPRICPTPGCIHTSPCPSHRTPTPYGPTHQRWRKLVLGRAGYVCQVPGCTATATDADHITPLYQGGDRYALANGQAMCHSHHSRKTRSERKQ